MISVALLSLMSIMASSRAFVLDPTVKSIVPNAALPHVGSNRLCVCALIHPTLEQPVVLQRQVVNSLELSSFQHNVISPMTEGTKRFLGATAIESSSGAGGATMAPLLSSRTSSSLLALQERRVPTADEVAAKRLTFNLWLWGGGFLAPLLATIFYFGPKFWTK
jgi:hypothetical protein